MREVDLAIVGAGPAGLAAAIEGAKRGGSVLLLDRNPKPGGQLIKQIHKFFGSREHQAGTRGVDIACDLYQQAQDLGVEMLLGCEVYDIHHNAGHTVLEILRTTVDAQKQGGLLFVSETFLAKKTILATGGVENALSFEGWTLPGVLGAGAAQTMINVWRVLPGKRVLMVGAGNVGLIVSYQLLQAGAEVVAVVEASPKISGYGVHAAKLRRAGVPILTSHTILAALGNSQVTGVKIGQVDACWQPLPGSEQVLDVDTICIATGLRPNTRLAALSGCRLTFSSGLGGWVPIHNTKLETTVPGVYVAGDAAGIEEASTALEEGRLAGICAASAMGKGTPADRDEAKTIEMRLCSLRGGPFCRHRQEAKQKLIDLAEAVCPKV